MQPQTQQKTDELTHSALPQADWSEAEPDVINEQAPQGIPAGEAEEAKGFIRKYLTAVVPASAKADYNPEWEPAEGTLLYKQLLKRHEQARREEGSGQSSKKKLKTSPPGVQELMRRHLTLADLGRELQGGRLEVFVRPVDETRWFKDKSSAWSSFIMSVRPQAASGCRRCCCRWWPPRAPLPRARLCLLAHGCAT